MAEVVAVVAEAAEVEAAEVEVEEEDNPSDGELSHLRLLSRALAGCTECPLTLS